ncbi:MAG: Epoxide hydrolase A [Acidimicrobiales bacterium]|nr:MAG: alpha/beta hydrolase [Actinomycetota bacterium]MBV6509056.1 Epoxide hydrolase A [Acidimicrobiales bacterium]RIK06236.1 MAG: epoxide hydrolase [Acidobacteriota bacterium]
MVAFPEPELLTLDRGGRRIDMEVFEQGEGLPVVFCHGFPELAFSWRHQLSAVADAGYRAIAPNQRGYGRTSAPEEISAYALGELAGDMAALLDTLDIERAVFVGHDWGGYVAWAMPIMHPDRTLGVVGVCTPYQPFPTTQLLRTLVGGDDQKLYILWFQEPGVAEGVMDQQVSLLFDRVMRGGLSPDQMVREMAASGEVDMNPFGRLASLAPAGELIADPDELAVYVDTFETTGFRGGINWYRNIDRNVQQHPEVGTAPLSLPCLMITAEWDPALRPAMAEGMDERCSDLETHMIAKAGHWVQQEYPEELNEVLLDWLTRRFPAEGSAGKT